MNSDNQTNPNSQITTQSSKGNGRKKVSMVKIEQKSNLQVTFSKRRVGLFKKTSELSTLCGAKAAVIVFSPGDKAHSFGNPSVEAISNCFLNKRTPQFTMDNGISDHLLANATIRQCNSHLINLEGQLERERLCKLELDNTRKWCPLAIDNLNYQQLDHLKKSVTSFKKNVEDTILATSNLGNSYVHQDPSKLFDGFDRMAANYGYMVQYPPAGSYSNYGYDGEGDVITYGAQGVTSNPSPHNP